MARSLPDADKRAIVEYPENVLGTRMQPWIHSHRVRLGLGIAVVMLVATGFAYSRFFREQPPPEFESDEDRFLFGSLGTEASDGVPYWVWLVLPRIVPDLLPGPGGYTALGIQSKDGYEMPIGLSRTTVGYPRVGINCALCHAPDNRTPPDDAVARRYVSFLSAAAADPRFTPGTILAEIAKNYRLSATDRAAVPADHHPRDAETPAGAARAGPDLGPRRHGPTPGRGVGNELHETVKA